MEAACKGGGCFAAGTHLLTPDGSKPIEEFQIGDLILCRDENDPIGPIVARAVIGTAQKYLPLLAIQVGDRSILTTAEHPFWVVEKGWVEAQQIEEGDLLLGASGEHTPVVTTAGPLEAAAVYNLQIDEYRTYLVTGPLWGFSVWVHNYPDGPGGVAPRTQLPANEAQIRHIFREAPGHLPDTPANRALLQGVADDAGALLGTDRFGNQWFAKLNADGTQTWVQVRNGTIINGGMNQAPRTFNPGTGLSGGGS